VIGRYTNDGLARYQAVRGLSRTEADAELGLLEDLVMIGGLGRQEALPMVGGAVDAADGPTTPMEHRQ
jgi:hypothetical protein